MNKGNSPLKTLRDTPNLAGGLLAVLAFIAAMLIIPAVKDIEPEIRWGLSAAIAAFAFYKGRRAVEKRLGKE